MALIAIADRNKLFLQIKHLLGYPLRPFELDDQQMLSLMEMSIEDYSSTVNQWLIEQQWVGLQGMNVETGDFLSAFTTKSNKFMESFTYAYSKQVGLGTNAPAAFGWELKRDFIITRADTQHYLIPKGREVNEVLWEVPPETGIGAGTGVATQGDPFVVAGGLSAGLYGWSYMGRPAMYMQPTYSTLLAAQDYRMKQRVMQSIMTYRITGLQSGEKMLHLYPIPGTMNEMASQWGKHYAGRKVFYWYYDTNGDDTLRDRCLDENDDIVRLPSDPPLQIMKWEKINSVAKQQVRDILLAYVKMTLGSVRGFYSGKVGVTDKELELDYRHLLDEGTALKEATLLTIRESLDRISLVTLTEDRARIAKAVNEERGFQPPMFPIISI
jgi:hypothetical protein